MQVLIKVVLRFIIILAATALGKKLPSTAGLIGVMPLTGAFPASCFLWWPSCVSGKTFPSLPSLP